MNELLTKIAHHLIADEPKDCGEQFLTGRAYGIAEMLSEIGRQSVAAKAPVGDSVDSYEFRKLLDDAISCAPGDQEYFNDALIVHITAWKDAQLAEATKAGRAYQKKVDEKIIDRLHAPQAQGEPVAMGHKCNVCKDTGIVYTGPIGDPPEQCDACFDQEPAPQADEVRDAG